MARKARGTAGAAQEQGITGGGAVTQEELNRVRQSPEVNGAVTMLQPYSAGMLGLMEQLEVRTEVDRHVMADLLRQVKTAMATVDEKFDPITKPMWAAWKAATAWRATVRGPLEQAEEIGKQKLGDYAVKLAAAEREKVRALEMAVQAQLPAPAPVPAYQPPTPWGLPTPQDPPPVAVYSYAPAPTPPAPALAGVSTRLRWTVEVDNDAQATAGLIAAGVQDMRGVGVASPFVRLDVSALNIAARMEGEVGELVRGVLGQVAGLRVVQAAAVTVREYE